MSPSPPSLSDLIRSVLLSESHEVLKGGASPAPAVIDFVWQEHYRVFIAYDAASLDSAVLGGSVLPEVHSTLYLYDYPAKACNGAYQVSSAFSASPGSGWGSIVYLSAIGKLGSVMPDRHSNTLAAIRTWQSLIRRKMIVGEPVSNVCLGDEIEGVRGHPDPAMNMSYRLADRLPLDVSTMIERGSGQMARLKRLGLSGRAQALLVLASDRTHPAHASRGT